MGIRKRGKKWYVDVSDGRGRRIRRSVGTSKAVAEMVAKDLDVKIARAEYLGIFEASTVPYSEYAAEWLTRKKETVSHATYGDYASIMKVYALPYFGSIPLCKVSRRDVEEFVEKLGALSAKRKNNIMVPVKCLFNDAKRRGEIKENPCEMVRRLKEGRTFVDPLSFPEMKAFLEHVTPHYVPYFTTAFLTGMRPNEMLALKWLHVDFAMRCITVREGRVQGIEGPPKTLSSYRDIDLLEPLFEVLSRHRQNAPADAKYVFVGEKGKPLQVDNIRHRVWYPALQRAKLRKRTMYQTRHTFASLMLSHGEDPLWVARMLGHTTLDMIFRHYGKFIRNRARRDGTRFLTGMQEEIGALPTAAPSAAVTALPERTERKLNEDSRHKFGTVIDFGKRKGLRQPVKSP